MASDLTHLPGPATFTEFAHESERQFALLLDFYGIPWEYEPREFAIDFDDDGKASAFFRPDFYLPEDDRYIEITTMSQKLVTKKNRKMRLLRSLYPNLNIKLFYLRDYLHLVLKYGLEEPPGMSGPAIPSRIPGPSRIVLSVDAGAVGAAVG
ncbi:hypothetical protein MNBD_ACTINO02-1242 [hydrothermal vent metagenome]|uniref:Uncharacterized protein n=1 Tax=hydrothermal vent metagenome TaxID=652676 RepID=A0A3B0T7L9_9ZZZZ